MLYFCVQWEIQGPGGQDVLRSESSVRHWRSAERSGAWTGCLVLCRVREAEQEDVQGIEACQGDEHAVP